jgi:hypothetical protein
MQIVKRAKRVDTRPAYPDRQPPPRAATAGANESLLRAPGDAAQDAIDLRQKVEALQGEYARRQWELGGLAYEMAARNYFRLDVLREQAAKLQVVDAELAEATRLAQLDESAAAGECGRCGALHGAGSFFCWQCGHPLSGENR